MKKIVVKWEVEDGYVGGDRPQETLIIIEDEMMPEEEWNELTEAQKKEHIESIVEEDFEQKITFAINDYGI